MTPSNETGRHALRRALAERFRSEDVEEWLELWRTSQGGEPRDDRIVLLAAAVPFAPSRPIDVLDLLCGPGDVGRAMLRRFAAARLDGVDRDPLLLALGDEVNRRRGVPARARLGDLWGPEWHTGLARGPGGGPVRYHAIAAATALHWFDVARLGELFADCHRLLLPGGVLLFAEPAAPSAAFATAYAAWTAARRHAGDDAAESAWRAFWDRARERLDYDARALSPPLPAGRQPIGDAGLPVSRYIELLRRAGFAEVDVLLREPTTVTMAAIKAPG